MITQTLSSKLPNTRSNENPARSSYAQPMAYHDTGVGGSMILSTKTKCQPAPTLNNAAYHDTTATSRTIKRV
eukprot:3903760-Rhodomonas_salina.1